MESTNWIRGLSLACGAQWAPTVWTAARSFQFAPLLRGQRFAGTIPDNRARNDSRHEFVGATPEARVTSKNSVAGSYSHLARLLAPWGEDVMTPKLSESAAPLTLNCAIIPVPVFIPPPASASSPTVDPTTGRKISPLTAAALCVKPCGQSASWQCGFVVC